MAVTLYCITVSRSGKKLLRVGFLFSFRFTEPYKTYDVFINSRKKVYCTFDSSAWAGSL